MVLCESKQPVFFPLFFPLFISVYLNSVVGHCLTVVFVAMQGSFSCFQCCVEHWDLWVFSSFLCLREMKLYGMVARDVCGDLY